MPRTAIVERLSKQIHQKNFCIDFLKIISKTDGYTDFKGLNIMEQMEKISPFLLYIIHFLKP